MTAAGAGPGRRQGLLSPTRSRIAAVFVLANVVICVLWSSVMSTAPQHRGLVVASIVTLAVGALCLVAVILLGRPWSTPVSTRQPNRNTAMSVLSLVAGLQLIGGIVAMVLLEAFSDVLAVEVFTMTVALSLVVLVLTVSVGRHLARTAAG